MAAVVVSVAQARNLRSRKEFAALY